MTTGTELIARILRPMRDATQDMFTDPEMIEYINEAIIDLATRERLIHEANTALSFTAGSANVPADAVQSRWLVITSGVEVAWLTPSMFKHYQETSDGDADRPIASIWDQVIHLYPASTGSYDYGYYALPTLLTAGANTFPLSQVWEKKTVRYGRAQCYYRLGEPELARDEMAVYEQGLRNSTTFDRNMGGRLSLSRELNEADLDPDAIHIGG